MSTPESSQNAARYSRSSWDAALASVTMHTSRLVIPSVSSAVTIPALSARGCGVLSCRVSIGQPQAPIPPTASSALRTIGLSTFDLYCFRCATTIEPLKAPARFNHQPWRGSRRERLETPHAARPPGDDRGPSASEVAQRFWESNASLRCRSQG